MNRLAWFEQDLSTILGMGGLIGALVFWVEHKLSTGDLVAASSVFGTWIGLRQKAPIPSTAPTVVTPVALATTTPEIT